ncbi:hypothetical protein SLS62_008255 [Diatrype stigma]|uniref:Spermatogenesis-associated protein 20-like TRX domain-containing protein n=1 Tax=Diatrype stigma TaxID=117547 RepID=A0AAN9YM32_9PEZI
MVPLWSPETLQLARDTNRLLFVSIGFAACHWCYVMERESFDDFSIAKMLNGYFIPVKVDREERPDIDRQYMGFLQETTGGGGWPLNVFVTPDLEPVFGGTYWPGPKVNPPGRGACFVQILEIMSNMWKNQEDKCRESGRAAVKQLRQVMETEYRTVHARDEEDVLELEVLRDSYLHYRAKFDTKFGGFGDQPKFPVPTHLGHLLKLASYPLPVREAVGEDTCEDARHMALKTLECMARGGIKDQTGHGFARYSVARDWSLPHFEKMPVLNHPNYPSGHANELYRLNDNAQLLSLFVDAWLVKRLPLFEEMACDVAEYLTARPMASPLGGIHASEAAHSLPGTDNKRLQDGAYFLWTMDEFKSILTEEEVGVCATYWKVKEGGNTEKRHDSHGDYQGKNTLCVLEETADIARKLNKSQYDIRRIISNAKQKLLAYRDESRQGPALDDKILTAWNGLAISGLARAGVVFNDTFYISAAVKAATCIKENLFHGDSGTLKRFYREGPGEIPGFADDYAFLIAGLIDLYGATFDDKWLSFADTLQRTQIDQFWDVDNHAFFTTQADQPDILIRSKDGVDNAEPSINGVSASNLFRLAALLNDTGYEKKAKQTLVAHAGAIRGFPAGYSGMMSSLIASKLGMGNLVVSGQGAGVDAMVRRYHESVTPRHTLVRIGMDTQSEWLCRRNTFVGNSDPQLGMVQLCESGVCTILSKEDIEKLFLD